jgi:hypothetical protein
MSKLMLKRTSSSHSTLAIFRLCIVLLVGWLPFCTLGAGGSLLHDIQYVFKAGTYQKAGRLVSLSAKDLRFASKVENVQGLLELAEHEHRIDPIQMMQLSRSFSSTSHGDSLLLTCLHNTKCQPAEFIKAVNTSKLHEEVVIRNPGLGLVLVSHVVGALNENLMIRYFKFSGWTRVEGQVGRTGFDGLFVKYENGVIKDVMIVESKYNTSQLQSTNHGLQMSEQWVRRKMVELKEHFPNDDVYEKIDKFIQAGSYRAVLWNLKVEDDALKIGLSKVKSKGGMVDIEVAKGTDIEGLSSPFTNSIKLNAPRNNFEAQVLSWYNEELAAVGRLASK